MLPFFGGFLKLLTQTPLLSKEPICVQFSLQQLKDLSNWLENIHLSLDIDEATMLGEESSESVEQQFRLHADVDLHRLAGCLHPEICWNVYLVLIMYIVQVCAP